MPEMNGLEMLKRLRAEHYVEMKAIMLTTEGNKRKILRALTAGADEYLMKPFDSQAYQEAQDNYQVVLGTPTTVTEKLRHVRDTLGVGHMCLWAMDGYMSHKDTVRCIELLGKEVIPALRAG